MVPLSGRPAAAGAHPKQVTYYRGSNECLFITETLRTLHFSDEDALIRTLMRTGRQLRAGIGVVPEDVLAEIFGLVT
ncbi:hypothetical protein [Rhodococcus marinonascens]|uniref:hypothetical protein n=1 Tax=Rhodococcus marinonascens TaxID=38311 RepID=UPI00093483BE|nr:hypothetical protein [Rhodococcus marinonascens]